MLKILVIEDNFEVRDNLCEILELANYEVFSAENGIAGVRLAIQHLPDLIICDIMMPELDGFGVLKILDKNPKTNTIPFIFLTAKVANSDFRKGMGLGADDYITKPFDDTELLEAIEMRLSKSQRLKQAFEGNSNSLRTFLTATKGIEGLQQLSENREKRSYSRKEAIYKEGNRAYWLFFVEKGTVKIHQINEFGKELIIHIFRKGDFFGHFPLLSSESYGDNATALEDCEISLVPKAAFMELIYNNKAVAAQFIQLMAQHCKATEQQLIEFAYSSVRRKVALALLTAARASNADSFSLSREELAAAAGTAKETLVRTLTEFRKQGLIVVENNKITLLDKVALEEMPQ